MELIKLKEVSKRYSKDLVLEDINLTIEEGDILGLIGQSGSGKTTLLNLLAGFLEPSEGNIDYYPGHASAPLDLVRHKHKIKKNFGFTPQHNSYYDKLTVKENLWHFGRMYGLPKKTLQNNIQNLMNFTRLAAHQNKLAEQLSGGMQKLGCLNCNEEN